MIDLGTSHYRAALDGGKTVIQEPCVIAHPDRGGVVIGSDAQRMIGRSPAHIRIVRPVELGVIVDLDGASLIIRDCVARLSPRRFGLKTKLSIAVPSNLTQIQRRSIEEAGKLAGAQSVQLINASVAAGLGAGLPIQAPRGCLVVHMGAGITEAAVLSMNEVVESNTLPSGGHALDAAIMERVRREYRFMIGQRTAEYVKHQLGGDDGLEMVEIRGRNLQTGLPDVLQVQRQVVDDLLESYCRSVVDLIGRTISACQPELAGDVYESGILLVGGGALMRHMVTRLGGQMAMTTIVAQAPETCVIRGLMRRRVDLDTANKSLQPWHPFTKRARLALRADGKGVES
ncbi:MAG: rod shape-determining protein [Firmicutes bacterium]|nr:rod shape-determining protein [Bacillota bacterium]